MQTIKLRLKDFKCFKDNIFELNNLTVLTGANASGKSTIIQALLLVNSAMRRQVVDSTCQLALSDPSRVLDYATVENFLHVGGEDNAVITVNGAEFVFRREERVHKRYFLIHCPDLEVTTSCPLRNLFYLCAERIGPRLEMNIDKTRLNDSGCQGEFIAPVIDNNSFTIVSAPRTMEGKERANFMKVLDSWMDYIFPGISINVSATGATKCQVKFNNKNLSGKNMSANVSLGICYALPIIVTCLLAQPDNTIIIENPEAHLHAKAQSNMGFFLGKMSSAGLRILLETHSEHIINGIRRAAVSQNGLKTEDVTIYFLENLNSFIISQKIQIDNLGNLSAFPVDFFDQQRQDAKAIFDLISNRI